jgi:uncharacterized protein
MENQISIEDNRERSRYEAHDAAGNLMGFVDYKLAREAIAFVHAETLPEYRGQGVAGSIATQSLDDARNAGLRVIPGCPFYEEFIKEHSEYSDLLSHHGPASL